MLCVSSTGILRKVIFATFALFACTVRAELWGADSKLTIASGVSRTGSRSLAVSGDSLHLAWLDSRSGNFAVYYKNSGDNGDSWSGDYQLGVDTNPQFPAIAASGGNVHLVWSEDRSGSPEIFYRRSTDNGTNWGNKVRLTDDDSASLVPAIAVWQLSAHVVWSDDRDGDYEIYYKRSTNNGTNWDVDRRLTTSTGESSRPSAGCADNVIHLVWHDDRDGNYEVYYKRSTNNGDTWADDTRLTTNDSSSMWPALAVSGGYLHVVWEEKRDGEREIYYKRSNDAGTTWSVDIPLTSDGIATATELHPSISAYESKVEVVWSDIVDGNREIYYIRSSDNGNTWEPIERLTDEPAASYAPSIAAWTYNVHVVWTDERDANAEIFYKHGLIGDIQPDNSIRNSFASTYIGDNIYNADATNQLAEQETPQTQPAVFHVRIANDGEIPEPFNVEGEVGFGGWTVAYYDSLTGGADITALVQYGIWQTAEIEPDSFIEIRVDVTPDLSVPQDSSLGILITSISSLDTTRRDAVKAITIASESAVDEDNPPVSYSFRVLPCAKEQTLEFYVPNRTHVTLVIADASGRIVRDLVRERMEPGSYSLAWDGCDRQGFKLPRGVYFAKLGTEEKTLTRKFVLID